MINCESEKGQKVIAKFKRLKEGAIVPKFANPGDAGMDLFSTEEYVLKPGERYGFGLGITSELPEGYFVRFHPKSGLAVKNGIDVLAGVIDNGYRGEWIVVLVNLGSEPKEFKSGDKIAQAIVQKLEATEIVEVDELSETQRGEGGFGSTGR